MLDFRDCPVVDNHCHVLEPEKKTIEPIWLAREFFHGIADIPTPGVAKTKLWGASDDLNFHARTARRGPCARSQPPSAC